LEAVRPHPCAPTHIAFGDRPGTCRFQRLKNMLFLDVKAINVVEKSVVSLGYQWQTRISGIAFAKSSLDVPFNHSVSHHSDAMGVRNQNWSAQATRLFEPGRSGHLSVAVHAVPRSEYPAAKLFALRQNRGDPRSDGPLTDH